MPRGNGAVSTQSAVASWRFGWLSSVPLLQVRFSFLTSMFVTEFTVAKRKCHESFNLGKLLVCLQQKLLVRW